jgi:hypothetical protein
VRPGISQVGDEEAAFNHESLLFASQLTGNRQTTIQTEKIFHGVVSATITGI